LLIRILAGIALAINAIMLAININQHESFWAVAALIGIILSAFVIYTEVTE
jgi:hypothetical protein